MMRGFVGLLVAAFLVASVDAQRVVIRNSNDPDNPSGGAPAAWEVAYTPYAMPHPLQAAWVSSCANTVNVTVGGLGVTPSHARTDVLAAINAASDDDCIMVPAVDGTEDWASSIAWSNKRLQIIGPGYANLKLTCHAYCFSYTASSSPTKPVRISGFWMEKQSNGDGPVNIDATGVRVFLRDFRIDNNKFTRTLDDSHWDITLKGIVAGLIDNNIFGDGLYPEWSVNSSGYTAFDNQSGAAGLCGTGTAHCSGYDSWKAKGVAFGDRDAVYFEQNTHVGKPTAGNNNWVQDAEYGVRWVIRYNTLNGIYQSHSARSVDRGGNIYSEIYRNTWEGTGSYRWAGILRGGTTMVFDNTVSGYDNNNFDVDGQRENTSACAASPSGMGQCDGTSSVSLEIDGNIEASGWPCVDQVGRGAVTGADTLASQQSWTPMRAWMNGPSSSCALGTSSCTHTIGISLNGCGTGATNYWKSHASPHTNGQWDYMNYGDGIAVYANVSDLPATCTSGDWAWVRGTGSWNAIVGGTQGLGYICL